MKLISFLLLIYVLNSNAVAGETVLMVSIDKKGVRSNEVRRAVEALNYQDPTMGICFVDARVEEYIPYTSAPYYGVAIINFKWKCDDYAQRFLSNWELSPQYSIWSNPEIGPTPGVSGSN